MEARHQRLPRVRDLAGVLRHPDFTLAARAAAVVARNILEHGLADGELINVNVPAVPADACEGFEVTRLGKRIYQDELVERLDPRGIPYYWIGGPPPSGVADPGTDFHAVVSRRIAITPIHLDLTGLRLLKRLALLDVGDPAGAPHRIRAAGGCPSAPARARPSDHELASTS